MSITSANVRVELSYEAARDPVTFHAYQNYFIAGLHALPEVTVDIPNTVDRYLAHARQRKLRGSARAWKLYSRLARSDSRETGDHVGRYLFHFAPQSAPLKAAVDVHDGRQVRDLSAYEWADVYFKANYWPGLCYGTKVLPLVNGNGALDLDRVQQLLELRTRPKELDLVFMSKIWACGGIQFFNGIEHHVRLFEALSQLQCNKLLRAVIPSLYPYSLMRPYLDRLEACGVPWTYHNVSIQTLWDALSTARVVFLRPGKHECISWRMIDLLAIGACVLYDKRPFPQWPEPLLPDVHFAECGCGMGEDASLPPIEHYDRIVPAVTALLRDADRMAHLRAESMRYFDAHASPQAVARYLLEQTRRAAAGAANAARAGQVA